MRNCADCGTSIIMHCDPHVTYAQTKTIKCLKCANVRVKHRGGRRDSAGRKPRLDARKSLTVRFDATTLRQLDHMAALWQCDRSDAVRQAVGITYQLNGRS